MIRKFQGFLLFIDSSQEAAEIKIAVTTEIVQILWDRAFWNKPTNWHWPRCVCLVPRCGTFYGIKEGIGFLIVERSVMDF